MRHISDSIMIFAAGFGTRMAPLTDHMPKPLVRVGPQTLLDHALDLAQGAGLGNIVVNTHYKGDQIQQHLQGRPIRISHEAEILDTGGGVKHAAPLLNEGTIFTLNSDAIWRGPNPLNVLMQNWRPEMGALLLCSDISAVTGRSAPGDFDINAQGHVQRGGTMVYLGAQIIALDHITKIAADVFSLNTVWDALISEKRLYTCMYSGKWCDVGRPENIKPAEKLLDMPNV